MEFVNLKFVRINNGNSCETDGSTLLDYHNLKMLEPIIVDDLLKLNNEEGNVLLYEQYLKKGFLLAPMRRRSEEKKTKTTNFPARVLLEITSKCNLKCVMCPRNVLKRPQIHMSKEVVLKCINEIDDHGVEGLWLYNIGEALLHPDFKEIFEHCQNKKNLGSIWLSTNGQSIDVEMMDLLIQSNLTFFNFSINAMKAQTYRLISPEGDYDILTSNFCKFLEKKKKFNRFGTTPWLRVQMVEQPQVITEIDLFLNEYAKKAEILSINMLEGFSQNVSQNVGYAKIRQHKLEKSCNRIKRDDCFIFSDGEVAFCDTDFNHEMSIGNIYNSTIEQIWSGSKHRNYELLNKQGRLEDIEMCRNCLDYDL